MSAHALLKMTRDLFRAMSLALRQKYPRSIVEMKEAIAAFFGSDSVAISCHCERSKIIVIKALTEVCSLENIASWNWRKIALAWSDSVLLTLRSLVGMWKTWHSFVKCVSRFCVKIRLCESNIRQHSTVDRRAYYNAFQNVLFFQVSYHGFNQKK